MLFETFPVSVSLAAIPLFYALNVHLRTIGFLQQCFLQFFLGNDEFIVCNTYGFGHAFKCQLHSRHEFSQ